MPACIKKVTLLGNLGRIRRFGNPLRQNGELQPGTSYTWKDDAGEQHEHTDWHRVVAYNGLGDIAERFLKKGSRVYLEGQLQTRKWTDSDGTELLHYGPQPGKP